MNIKELKETLWATGKKICKPLDPDIQKHLTLGLVFLKYITTFSNDSVTGDFKQTSNSATAENSGNKENPLFQNTFFVPEKAQWVFLQKNAAHPDIGILADDGIAATEKLNKSLADTFAKNYSDPAVDKLVLGQFINLLGTTDSVSQGHKQRELLAEIFDYLLLLFAQSKGSPHPFHTPPGVVKLLVRMIAPRSGNMYDGCCGTGDMFVQTQKFIKKRGNTNELFAYGQERNPIALKIAKMNLLLHNVEANLQPGDAFTNDCFPELSADYILVNPSDSIKDRNTTWLHDDKRWRYGMPPEENTDYAWLQHFVSKLSPAGTAAVILDKSSAGRNNEKEIKIRKKLLAAKLIDCIVTLPSKLFYSSKAAACIWILTNNTNNNTYKKAKQQILFIDAQKLGAAVAGRNKELTDEDIAVITRTYQRWKNINGDYIDIKGFCKAVLIEEVKTNGYNLLPEKYISRKRVKAVLPALLLIMLLAVLYFSGEKKGLFTASPPKMPDTAIAIQPRVLKDSAAAHERKAGKTVKKEANKPQAAVKDTVARVNNGVVKANDSAAEVKKHPVRVSKTTAEIKPSVAKAALPEAKSENGIIKYKVNSTAYFYNEPNESTRRRAFITHWNNWYADIRALDEKNNFIYVVFTNHLNQTSRGWLRKADLKEIKQ